MSTSDGNLMIGTLIAQYRILEKLGEGGMGVVYKAEDTRLARMVALKFLPQRLNESDQDKARFLQEARAAAALNHPNVCSVIDIQEQDGRTFIVMEYVDGVTLREYRAPSPDMALECAVQIAEGLSAAHEKGVVHRDIKPENIMVRKDGIVQIMDFGVAKLQGVSRLTKEGSTIGTAGYMSPEQVRGMDADHRSDIFSLGVVLYEFFTGSRPFQGAHETAMSYEIVNVDPPPMSAVRPGLDPELDRIVAQCLAKDPAERMQWARQVAVDLKRCRRLSGIRTSTRPAPPGEGAGAGPGLQSRTAARAGKSTHKYLIVGAGALLLCVAAAWFYLGRHAGPISSMVVLPFENVGSNPDLEYLSDGVTEGIINKLSKTPGLRVIPRSASFRYKGSSKDPSTIGKDLGVDAVLSGRVVQRGNTLDLSLELVDVRAYAQVWGESYRRTLDDLIVVQNEIADAVRSQISPASAGSSVATERSGTTNPAAYRLYLQGRYCWNKRTASDLERALGYFQQAIALDKEFALAHLGIAETYTLQGQYADRSFAEIKPRATEEAERAIEIDNSLGEAHAVLGQIQEYAWDWADAEREFKLALEKAPAYATAYHWYFIFLGVMGRDDEAFSAIKKAVELDPYSPIIQANLVQAYMGRGDDGDADEVAKKILAIEPQFFFGRVFRAEILARQGHSKEALGYLDGINLAGLSSHNLGSVAYAYASAGETGKARMILRDLCRVNRDSNTDPVAIAMIYAGLGDADSTITWLQNARDKRSILLPNARVWREFRLVHDDPRYVSILRSMGLPLPGE